MHYAAARSLAIARASGIDVDLIDLDVALVLRRSRMVEISRVLDVSKTTIEREWRAAKAWLARRLGP